ncbi:hypothetical protein [Cytophaga hutchinsonii]|jgi:hypothetical protein|uniref:PA14 domain-containing protein n=1 Tax=Cytophaga hutchinsonii (strain ATCC 33406 / DSM 1761 / CIP 103989 / NBRC 15051 / NCIMB 9469 / D465) TaxID=269798 RepID=A0A6N4SR85_CYTH3|nr:hypothetical protein [Cytophaga hutchinsonii]ABG58792.1 conserved hypothetical protein [Cytophaga hutchinsonii ATCC 33406]SFX61961.1 hypothetical protein SAMN04487930_106185 [Cytophaga hutchinsonii ATCC 33406]
MFLRLAKHQRIIASFLLINFLTFFIPIQSKALSSGPSQPETQQFAPAGMDDMVDPFTGDFSYNIPLMDVGGYPINLNYASGITPDAEASWTGLGWNLNVGAINRSVRGLPDDFGGDDIRTDFNVAPNETYGTKVSVGIRFFDAKVDKLVRANLGVNANIFYNTYNGIGISAGINPSISSGSGTKDGLVGNLGVSLQAGSESGLDISPTLGISNTEDNGKKEQGLNASIGFPFNTREGLKGMTISAGYSPSSKSSLYGTNFGGNAFQGFSTPTYTPTIQQSHRNLSIGTNFAIQFSNPVSELGNLGFEGYYNGQFLKNTTTHNPAYGYMYSSAGSSDLKLYDINREKDGAYHKKYTQNLPVTNYTYDIFSVSGQGVSGTYRLHRGDFGIVSDPVAKDESIAPAGGVSLGLGANSIDVGVNGAYYKTNAISGKWTGDNGNFPVFNSETNLNNATKEVVYFKKMGESTVENDLVFLNDVQKSTDLLQYNLASSVYGIPTNTYANASAVKQVNSRSSRPNKTSAFTTLTAAEASRGAVLPIQNYVMNTFDWIDGRSEADKKLNTSNKNIGYVKDTLKRIDNLRKAHHISEVRVTDQSGSRYVYGIPAYNISQQEITFAVNSGSAATKNAAVNSGLVSYQSSDLGNNNRNGLDNYYNNISTPANAHSYLLTCILSSDYVDSDNIPGPSNGDLGTYTKFNYSKLPVNFLWRTPMSESERIASFSEGMKGDNLDDKGNIIYGEKEVWYLHSIETPTHVAEFHLSPRLDGFGAEGLDGKIGNTALMKLDKIVLYAKADKLNSSAEPIKTVYFSYSYKLCPGTVNSKFDAALNPAKGKLTLEKVWFTYGGSKKGVLNPYVFTYADQDFDGNMDAALNPSYSHLNYDRWGTYKFNNLPGNSENKLPNGVFPYTDQQNKSAVDNNAAVYALSTIQMPTAGTMHVVYESDDYAYVQDKKAMRMYTIADESDVLFTNAFDQKNFITINLGEGFIPKTSNRNQEFQDLYIGATELMYFKVLMNVINPSITTSKARTEYVPGYAEIDKGSCTLDESSLQGNKYTKAKIVFQKVKSGGVVVNPISRAGWMFAKLNLGRELKGLGNAKDAGMETIMLALISQISSVATVFAGYTSEMIAKQHSNQIVPKESYVKLLEPDQIKLGGGHRVKAIIMSDSWALMKSVKENQQPGLVKQTSYYGQTYSYTKNENNRTISSGVAAYEPIMGGDENPFRKPVFVEEKIPLAANNTHFLEEPFGECFFPAPTVGYSKVVVTPVKLTVANIQNKNYTVGNGTGRVEQEFYTAKDFPTYTERTKIIKAGLNPNMISKFMRFASTDLATCTQGYYIETNDMHGKPKSKRVYPEIPVNSQETNPQPISEVEYKYKTLGGKLDNQVKTINPDLTIPAATSTLGVDVDVVNDQRESTSTTEGGGFSGHLKTIVIFIPLPVPTGFPDVGDELVQFRSVVTTKVANRYGILEETIAKDNGASISTKNLAWDAKTGEVILTSLQNEFHDPIYTFNYPAHWAYTRMSHASETEGMSFSKNYFDTHTGLFKDGDELILDTGIKAFVNKPDMSTVQVINKNGVPVSFARAKVIRSGARNMPSAPIGTVVTLTNPMQGNVVEFNNVINAGASEYKETWKRMGCDCEDATKSTNPYITGVKGNLRPYRSWTYLTDRYQRLVNNQMNIRTDGFYKDFATFWQYKQNGLLGLPDNVAATKWQYVTEITNYNPLGLEIENKDALGRYLMAQYGYGRKLPVATSNNSQYRESGFDGFEDYDYGDCIDDHFSWRNAKTSVTEAEAHTGRKSIKVGSGQKLEIKKVILPCE